MNTHGDDRMNDVRHLHRFTSLREIRKIQDETGHARDNAEQGYAEPEPGFLGDIEAP